MTRKDTERLLERWRQRLVPEWHVEIDWDEQADEGNDGQVWRPTDYFRATILVGENWSKMTDAEQEQTVLHELLHLLLRDLRETFKRFDGQVHRDTYNALDETWMHGEEGLVDRLAWSLTGLK